MTTNRCSLSQHVVAVMAVLLISGLVHGGIVLMDDLSADQPRPADTVAEKVMVSLTLR